MASPVDSASVRQLPDESEVTSHERRVRVRRSAYLLVVAVVLGIVLAVLWVGFAPRPELVVRDGGAFYQSLANSGIGMDMTFAVIAAGCGLIAGSLACRLTRRGGSEVVLAAGVGGLLGSVLGWRIGEAIVGGVHDNGNIIIPEIANDQTFLSPLRLSAMGVLGIWPLVAVGVMSTAFVWQSWRAGQRAREISQESLDQEES